MDGSGELPLDSLIARHEAWIRAAVKKRLGADAEDVVQDVFLRLLRAASSRARTHDEERALVAAAIRSAVVDEYRRRAKDFDPLEDCDLPATSVAPSAASDLRDDLARFDSRWTALSENERAVLRLRLVRGLKFKAIAEVLDQPQGSVAATFSRALARLRGEGGVR